LQQNIFSVLPVSGCTALDNLCKWYLKIWPNLLRKYVVYYINYDLITGFMYIMVDIKSV